MDLTFLNESNLTASGALINLKDIPIQRETKLKLLNTYFQGFIMNIRVGYSRLDHPCKNVVYKNTTLTQKIAHL
jgi:hypothetical protein